MRLFQKIFLLLIVLFLFFSLTKNFFDFRKSLDFYLNFKNDYLYEKKKNIELKTELIKEKDPHEIEKTIRNKLNLFKPNEKAIILPNLKLSVTPTPTPTPPIYKQWLNLFLPR